MLSHEDNTLLTRIGPETSMGQLQRRFWFPALLVSEVPTPDCPPVRVRLLGEDLVAFRDSDGRVGILDAYCPHRRAPLFFGRNEECGLRCGYHGWKFDVHGACTDVPTEPDQSAFSSRVSIKAYPTWQGGGAVWVYMGPPALKPKIPDFEWLRLPEARSYVTKRLQRTNWAQAVEGGIDSAHISFLHSRTDAQDAASSNATRDRELNSLGKTFANRTAADRRPTFEVKETDYGLLIAARRNAGADSYYWRITQFLMPFFQMIPPSDESTPAGVPYSGHAWVPIDDQNTWIWSFGASPSADYTDEERENFTGRDGFWGPVDDNYVPLRNMSNDYLIDRNMQRDENFSGILGVANQDAAMQEGMGRIVDRTLERLGKSDRGVAAFRRMMINAARQLQQGNEPVVAKCSHRYNVRSASVVLGRSVPFETGAKALLAVDTMLYAGTNDPA